MRATFTRFDKGLFLKIHRYIIVYYAIINCGWLTKFSLILEDHLIFNYGPFIRVLLLFKRNMSSVCLVFMTQHVFQSLQVDHIQILLLLLFFWESLVLMLLHLILDHLYGCFFYFRGLSLYIQDSAYNLKFKLLFIVVFFRMVHNEKIFRRSGVKYRIFSESHI